MRMNQARSGFSLVELSIVLVILGLLVGGILGGQSLIRAAELRAAVTEYEQWQTAVNSFKEKYHALPGDMSNATRFWGAVDSCNLSYNVAVFPDKRTCDGNGNGALSGMTSSRPANVSEDEYLLFWHHLSNAGLINQKMTGLRRSGSNEGFGVPGEGVPKSKMGGGWGAFYITNAPYNNRSTEGPMRGWQFSHIKSQNAFLLWSASAHSYAWFELISSAYAQVVTYPAPTNVGVMSGVEAWQIDSKIDDGKPDSGNVWVASAPATCWETVEGVREYNVSSTGGGCALHFAF